MLPAQLIVKSFNVCALSSGLDGSEDNNIACIKHGPCQDLLSRLQAASLDKDQADPSQNGTLERRTSMNF